jgi:hypothetical protein
MEVYFIQHLFSYNTGLFETGVTPCYSTAHKLLSPTILCDVTNLDVVVEKARLACE